MKPGESKLVDRGSYVMQIHIPSEDKPSAPPLDEERVKAFVSFRRFLMEASAKIEELADDFTQLDLDDSRSDIFDCGVMRVADLLEEAGAVRDRWFNPRATKTEGGDS